ncbi:MAG: hypothetical protein ACREN5_10480, partial [Gemmatimonadales bacterium]
MSTAALGGVVSSVSGAPNIFGSGATVLFRSTNGGASFSSTNVLGGERHAPFPPLVLDPVNPAVALIAGRRVFRTADSGATWTALATVDPDANRVVTALAMAPMARQIMFAATACLPEVTPLAICTNDSNLWRSNNSGQVWVRAGILPGRVNRLAVDPRQPNVLYAAVGAFPGGPNASAGYSAGNLIRLSAAPPDGTLTPVSIRANLPDVPINTILIDPSPAPMFLPAQTLYVGTDAGVFVTFNAGVQWTAINTG